MAIAEIITIGTELLLGEIQDTNSKYIARVLRDIGVDIYRLTTVGDNQYRITATIQEAMSRADIIITTGGLGPTVDDPTRQAVADSVGVELEYHPELWETIKKRFENFSRTPTENNKRQAFIPAGALVIENKVGTAPAFSVEHGEKSIVSLPGVPREMEYLMDNIVLAYLKKRYKLQDTVIKARVVHTASLGESSIDEIIGDMETLINPTVGLLAHPGQTDIRITAKASSVGEAERMIKPIIEILKQKLGNYIFGVDDETLESVVADLLEEKKLGLAIVEYGLEQSILSNMKAFTPTRVVGERLDTQLSNEMIKKIMEEFSLNENVNIVMGLKLLSGENKQDLFLSILARNMFTDHVRTYDGPKGNAPQWATNLGLDSIRRKLIEEF